MGRHRRLATPSGAAAAREEPAFLSVEQAGKLLEAARVSEYLKLGLLLLMGIATGARRGELEALRWSAIEFDARTALLRDTKNGDSRVLTDGLPPLRRGTRRFI
jgi:integrase